MNGPELVALILSGSFRETPSLLRWSREAFACLEQVSELAELNQRHPDAAPALIITDNPAFLVAHPEVAQSRTSVMVVVDDISTGNLGALIESPAADILIVPATKAEFILRARRAMMRRTASMVAIAAAQEPTHEPTIAPPAPAAEAQDPMARDPMANALSRASLVEQAPALEQSARDNGQRLAVQVFDVRGIPRANALFGRAVGDRLLRAFAERLAEALPPGAHLFRAGGSAFAVVEPPLSGNLATIGAPDFRAIVNMPFDIAGDDLRADTAIGRAEQAHNEEMLEQLVGRAMEAAAKAREEGVDFLALEAAPEEDLQPQIEAIRGAIENGELLLHYQRQIDLGTGMIAGVEAMLRWQRPGQGMVMPASFLPLAARAGLSSALTRLVLRQTKLDFLAAQRHGQPFPRVSINVSAQELAEGTLEQDVLRFLETNPEMAQHLDIEVPPPAESARDIWTSTLWTLHNAGISLTLEVSAHASVEKLNIRQAPVNRVKFDATFVENGQAKRLAQETLQAGIMPVMGGIESPQQIAAARALGCVEAQGYYLGYPQALQGLMAAA